MFIDEVTLTCQAGAGGNGTVAWRRVKYIPKWGPYGGDGGTGGDIILRATTHENTLTKFRHISIIRASDGEKWGNKEMHGQSADDTIIEVPVGTLVTDLDSWETIIDLVESGQTHTLCRWGKWGFGNAHFASSTRQAPDFAELGDVGESRRVKMELKLVADVGIIGLPNAGKSTLIQAITNVRPKIADYEFTTLIPNLGVMEHKGRSLVIEDVPGLIKGASEGKGLGIRFLRHIDRTNLLIHLIDASTDLETIIESYQTIRSELEQWSDSIATKPEIIIFSKADIIDPEMLDEMSRDFERATGKPVSLTISAGARIRTNELKDLLLSIIPEPTRVEIEMIEEDEAGNMIDRGEIRLLPHDFAREERRKKQCQIHRLDSSTFEVTGERIEEIARMTNMRQIEGVNRVYDVLARLGVITKIEAMLRQDLEEQGWSKGFFVGEEDLQIPVILIAGNRFPLDSLFFMRREK